MKIIDIDCKIVNWEKSITKEKRLIQNNSAIILVKTDEGLMGIGEPAVQSGSNAPMIIDFITNYLKNFVIGEDPFNIEKIWKKMYSYAIFYPNNGIVRNAMSGIEIAIWDIIGKFLKIPIYNLFGGRYNDKIRVYLSGTPWPPHQSINDHFTLVDEAIREGGFTAYKERATHGLKKDVALVKAFRDTFGYDLDLLVDMCKLYDPINAIKFAREVEKYDVFLLEEPIPPESIEMLANISEKINIPIAVGESIQDKFGFAEVISKKAASIIQPCATHTGIMEMKKISTFAESYYMPIAPHNFASSVTLAANLQVATCSPNFLIFEYPNVANPLDLFLKKSIKVKDGYIEPSKTPGLGLELDGNKLEEYQYKESDISIIAKQSIEQLRKISPKDLIEYPTYI